MRNLACYRRQRPHSAATSTTYSQLRVPFVASRSVVLPAFHAVVRQRQRVAAAAALVGAFVLCLVPGKLRSRDENLRDKILLHMHSQETKNVLIALFFLNATFKAGTGLSSLTVG